ncbi:MAG: hypothetical protein ACXWUG_15165, partial [Polyangiales bacterium]
MMEELGKVVNTAAPSTGTATTAVPVKAPKQSKTGGAEILLVAVALAAVAWLVIKRKPVQAKPASAPAPKAEPPKKDDPDKDESKPEGA